MQMQVRIQKQQYFISINTQWRFYVVAGGSTNQLHPQFLALHPQYGMQQKLSL